MRRAPLAVGAVLLLWTLGAATGSLGNGPAPQLARWVGVGLGPLRDGHWWVVGTAALWCSELASYAVSTLLVLLVLPVAERRIGSARTAGLLVAVQVLGSVAGLSVVLLLTLTDGRWPTLLDSAVVVDPTAAVLGMALVLSAALPTLWRRRIRVFLLVTLVTLALYSGLLADLLRLGNGLVGLGVGVLLFGRGRRVAAGPSRPEVRVLVALVVAASAVGPLVAVVAGTGVGPLSVLRFVFAAPPPDAATVLQICTDPAAAERCVDLQARLRLGGAGPATMSVMPVLLLLVAAEGLRRGRHAAWLAATGLHLGLAGLGVVLAITTAATPAGQRVVLGPGTHLHSLLQLGLPTLQPLLVAVLLVAARRQFTVRAPAGTYRRWTLLVGVTLAVVSVTYVAGSLAWAADFDRPPGLVALITDLPTRFLPPGYLGEIEPAFLPERPPTVLLYEWTGVVFWAVVGAAGLVTFTRARLPVRDSDEARIRALLVDPGGADMSYMVTWPGHTYWFADNSRAAVAYRVIGGVALSTGDPIGVPEHRGDDVRGFVAHCQRSGWTPCLYSVGGDTVAATRAMGWSDVQVAEETVLPLADLRFTGKAWQDVRTALHRAAKAGITAEWSRFRHAPLAITDQIRVISEAWVADKGLPELGFTLGGLDELADDDVRLLLAVDADRTVQGVTSWLPVHRDGVLVGWTLDFMRRRSDGFRGVMEFLIASAALDCQREGAAFLSLSGAPLARIDRGVPAAGLQRALDIIGRALEPVYGFRSLLAFKAKFQPVYQPLYLAYPDPAALPTIGNAIGRAYLPRLTARQLGRLARNLLP